MLVVGHDFVPVLDAIADTLTTVGTILVIGGLVRAAQGLPWPLRHVRAAAARGAGAGRGGAPAPQQPDAGGLEPARSSGKYDRWPMGTSNIGDILRTHADERAEAVSLVLGERSMSWGELYERASRVAAGLARRRRRQPGPRSRSSTRTASSTSRCSSAPPWPTPCASTSTGASPRPRSSSSSTTPRPRCSSSGPTSSRSSTPSPTRSTTVGTILVIGGHEKYQDYDEWVAEHAPVDPHDPERSRRRGVPALLERHDGPTQGRDAVQRQLLRPAPGRPPTCGSSGRTR